MNIQVTREIESEIVNCAEIETSLAVRESELTKSLFMSHFEINGLLSVTGNFIYEQTPCLPSYLVCVCCL